MDWHEKKWYEKFTIVLLIIAGIALIINSGAGVFDNLTGNLVQEIKRACPYACTNLAHDFNYNTEPYILVNTGFAQNWDVGDKVLIASEEFTVKCISPAGDTYCWNELSKFDFVKLDRKPTSTYRAGKLVCTNYDDCPYFEKCIDSDGGLEYYSSGYVETRFGRKHYDMCIGKVMYEKYCTDADRVGTSKHMCENTCYKGRCWA